MAFPLRGAGSGTQFDADIPTEIVPQRTPPFLTELNHILLASGRIWIVPVFRLKTGDLFSERKRTHNGVTGRLI